MGGSRDNRLQWLCSGVRVVQKVLCGVGCLALRGASVLPFYRPKEGLRVTCLRKRKQKRGSGYSHRVTARHPSISPAPHAWNSSGGGPVISLHVIDVVRLSFFHTVEGVLGILV